MLVGQLMTPAPVTVDLDATVAHIKELFDDHLFHHLVVVERGEVVGVISDRDLLRSLSPFVGRRDERAADARLLQRHAHQIMSRHPVCVRQTTTAAEAAGLILAHRISCLPVVDAGNHVVGIITWRDLISWSLGEMAHAHGRAA
jgi:acetoin utilization protein AcuB